MGIADVERVDAICLKLLRTYLERRERQDLIGI